MTFPQHEDRKEARPGGGPTLERAAVVLAIIWAAGVLVFAILSPPAGGTTFLTLAMTLLVVLLPLALIWLALTTLRTLRELRAETAALQAMVEALRGPGDAGSHGTAQAAPDPAPSRRAAPLREAAAGAAGHSFRAAATGRPATGRTGDHSAPAPATARDRQGAARAAAETPPPSPRAATPQDADSRNEPALALDAPDERPPEPLSAEEFIRALQFPDSAEDAEGVRALRLALEDRELARLIRAAQDVLTLLSQEGVYMDDLAPEPAQAGQWRLFAAGVRGDAVASVGGIRDHAPLALTTARMREDAIFRDAAHHFLRAFDRSFQAFEKSASDAEILDLAQTRTARAFMLFGRVAGVFD